MLFAEPAALYLDSARPKPDERGVVHVAVDTARRVSTPAGVRVHRVVGLAAQVRWSQ
ncbi:hypothetical protein [Nocardioides sp.]|uniref:hypothetical protein n=1 Tax=Nocardioides sp. TaxID=35761 RepID=UPI00286ADD8A|nr:hypothetical protein [Nocardioides sp.]